MLSWETMSAHVYDCHQEMSLGRKPIIYNDAQNGFTFTSYRLAPLRNLNLQAGSEITLPAEVICEMIGS